MGTKSLIISQIDEQLKPLGFARHKAIWNRQLDPFVDVIDVQTSKAGDTITLNAGVLHREVYKKCWAADPPAVIEEPSCTVRVRVGQLVGGKDLWWPVNDAGTVNGVVGNLRAHVLPFLEQMHSLEAMEQFLEAAQVAKQKYPLPVISLAIINNELGNSTDACAILAALRDKTVGAWRSRISEVAVRLKCS